LRTDATHNLASAFGPLAATAAAAAAEGASLPAKAPHRGPLHDSLGPIQRPCRHLAWVNGCNLYVGVACLPTPIHRCLVVGIVERSLVLVAHLAALITACPDTPDMA